MYLLFIMREFRFFIHIYWVPSVTRLWEYLRNQNKVLFLMVETDSKQIHDTVTVVGGSVYFVLCAFLSRISGYGHLLKYFLTSSFH